MNTDMSKVEAFAGQVVTDIAAAFSGVMTNIGHKLGLYNEAGMDGCIRFEVASAKGYQQQGFDLICVMDCLHDMGDPVGAARHARTALTDDGTLLLVEPAAGDGVAENINPVSRLYYAASTAVCTPCSKSQ